MRGKGRGGREGEGGEGEERGGERDCHMWQAQVENEH